MKTNSGYGTWTLLYNKYKKDYEVIQILDYNKQLLQKDNLEFFQGTYEKAKEYFLGNEKEEIFDREKIFDRFMMSIEYYQLEEKCVSRLSSEIFSNLSKLCSYKKYYVPERYRLELIFDCLEEAKIRKLIKDEQIKRRLQEKDEFNKRLFKQNQFEKDYREQLLERGLI